MIKLVKFVTIPVTDQDRALEFYTKQLGFRIITDSPFDGRQRWIELGIPRAETKVLLFMATGQETAIGGYSNISFAADNVKETVNELKARGVEFVQEPTKEDWGEYAVFKDPDGNMFVVSTP